MGVFDSFQVPTTALDLFIRSVEISAYIPGRVRLHSRNLINNPGLEKEVKAQLLAFRELKKVETSIVTGSILIFYEPAELRGNEQLRKVEEYIMTHARRK